MVKSCDQPRRNDLDGGGNSSEEALAPFTRFFLELCIDQVKIMKNLVQRITCNVERERDSTRKSSTEIGTSPRSRAISRRAATRRHRQYHRRRLPPSAPCSFFTIRHFFTNRQR